MKEIELTEEQIDRIANVVKTDLRRNANAYRERTRRDINVGRGTIAHKEPTCRDVITSSTGRDLNLLLTVRSDLNAIVNAMNAGHWRHAKFLAEGLLGHVDETIEEA